MYEPNKGVRVTSPLSDEERNVVAGMRLSLEKHCLSKFMKNMSENDHRELSLLLERLISACERASLPEVAERDLALHRYWVAQASSHLETMWLGLSVRMIMKYSRLAKYEDIANVGSLILPGGYHLGINAPDDFKEELAKRLDYFHRRQR